MHPFGPDYVRQLRRRIPRPASGTSTRCSSRSADSANPCDGKVDQHGNVIDILIQGERDRKAATGFFRALPKRLSPRMPITDKIASHRVAHRETMSRTDHRQTKYLNNRCELPPTTAPK
ncbi:DDE-type integrase/transposase/recombinase [Rhodococcus erythropolis]|uniref:DDE-type integrase/transposase/recombinase n=1 Tax=Rhodococcus erythropolis TaxID=1833 RepID=UPI00374ECD0E